MAHMQKDENEDALRMLRLGIYHGIYHSSILKDSTKTSSTFQNTFGAQVAKHHHVLISIRKLGGFVLISQCYGFRRVNPSIHEIVFAVSAINYWGKVTAE